MKKISLILFLFSIITFSCSNLNDVNPFSQNNAGGENSTQNDSDPESPCYYDPQLNKYVLQISFSLNDKSGAVPASKTVESRSALASGGSDTSSITNIKVYSSQNGNDFSLLSQAAQASEKISLTLSAGTYWLRAEAYAGENLVYKTSSDLKIELTGAELSEPLVLHLICINSGSQSSESGQSADKVFELPMKIASVFSAYEVICDDSSYNNAVINCFNVSKTSINSGFSGPYTKTVSGGIPSGTYIVKFNFYQKDSSTGIEYIAYSIPYVDITVSKGLTTDTWVGNENDYLTPKADGTLEMNITSALAFNLSTVYVDSSLSKSGSGSSVNKFNSLDEAAAAANKMPKCNTIVLTGNKTYPISKTISINKAMTIKSSTSLAATISRENGFTDASMLKVNLSYGLLLDGITLNIQSKTGTGTVTGTFADGAGIYNSGDVTLRNTTIKNGKCASGNHGSGIYNNGILTLYAGVTFTDCDVYLTSGKNITVASPSITGVVITPADYSTPNPLLKGIIDDVPIELNSSYLTYIAPFSVTKNGSDNYYLDTSAKLIKEVIPISILAEKITSVPSSTDYPKLQAELPSDITQIAEWCDDGCDFAGITISLSKEIDMQGVTNFPGIGQKCSGRLPDEKVFKGVFDGNGQTIKNLNHSLFNNIVSNETQGQDDTKIQNLTIEGTVTKNNCGICDNMFGGTISNCTNKCQINNPDISDRAYLGGIVSFMLGGTIKECTNNGKIKSDYAGKIGFSVGGIVGRISSNSKEVLIQDCKNICTTDNLYNPKSPSNDTNATGGIVGSINVSNNKVTILNCENRQNVTGGSRLGGIVGNSGNGDIDKYLTIEGCTNKASVSYAAGSDLTSYCGGIIGRCGTYSIINKCQNIGFSGKEIYATLDSAGGICGYCDGTVRNCLNSMDVKSGSGYGGGIVGECNDNASIANCYNEGKVFREFPMDGARDLGYIGGIVGYVKNISKIENCINIGQVDNNTSATTEKGGIAGKLDSIPDSGTAVYNYYASDESNRRDAVGSFSGSGSLYDNMYLLIFIPIKTSDHKFLTSGSTIQGPESSSKEVPDLLNQWVTEKTENGASYLGWVYDGSNYRYSFVSE